MAVYVDDMEAPYGRMKMCHMIADSSRELIQMVDRIGVHRRWIQDRGTYREHFDVCMAKRALAVREGAQEVTMFRLVELMNQRR